MNFLQHSWDNKVKSHFLDFIKVAKNLKNDKFCNAEEYHILKTVIYLNEATKEEVKLYPKETDIFIDITQSDDEQFQSNMPASANQEATNFCNQSNTNLQEATRDSNINITMDELLEEIKDRLSADKFNTQPIMEKLISLNKSSIEKLFDSLARILTLEEIRMFWISLRSSNSYDDSILAVFIQFFILPNSNLAYNYEIEEVFRAMCEKDGKLLRSELVKELAKKDNSNNHIIIQYLTAFGNGYNTEMLRDFISFIGKLESSYIPVIETLLNNGVNQDVLCQLIQIMASYSMDFCNDNSYGKLLYKLVNLLNKNFRSLEQPLKRILGTHKSIWKMKIEKCIVSWFNETLTQSFI